MAYEKLGNLQEETVPQDLDLMEREVIELLAQQQREAVNQQRLEDVKFDASKFAANCNKSAAPAKEASAKKRPAFSLFFDPAQIQEKQNDKIRFVKPARNKNKPQEKTSEAAPAKSIFAPLRMLVSRASPEALQQELGVIRRAKTNPFLSVARLLKGLGQGDDLAEQYVERHRPDLLKKPLKAPAA